MGKNFVQLVTIGIAAAITWGVALPIQAAEKEKSKKEKSHRITVHGKVSAMDKINKTITVEDKEQSRTIQVTSRTRILKEGKPAIFDDVKVGDEIASQLRKTAEGKEEVISLRLGPKPEAKHKKKSGDEKEKN